MTGESNFAYKSRVKSIQGLDICSLQYVRAPHTKF